MYRPLPAGLTIGQSKIDGLGLITTDPIPANTVLGIAHIANSNFPHGHIRTALGAFYNHSDEPNCKTQNGWWQHMPVKYLVTTTDINAGDELTAKYTLYLEFDE